MDNELAAKRGRAAKANVERVLRDFSARLSYFPPLPDGSFDTRRKETVSPSSW